MKEDKLIKLINEAADTQDLFMEYGEDVFDNTKLYVFMRDYPVFSNIVTKYLKAVSGVNVDALSISTKMSDLLVMDDWKALYAAVDKHALGKPVQYERLWEIYGYRDVLEGEM